jgi:hypothetical protein
MIVDGFKLFYAQLGNLYLIYGDVMNCDVKCWKSSVLMAFDQGEIVV